MQQVALFSVSLYPDDLVQKPTLEILETKVEIPEKTLAAIKNVVFRILDNGVVKDVSLRRDTDFYGEKCLRVRLYVGAGTKLKDFDYCLEDLKFPIRRVMFHDDECESLTPYIEVRAVAESDEPTSEADLGRDLAQSTVVSDHLPADIASDVESENLRWKMYEVLTETLCGGRGIATDLFRGKIEISIADGIKLHWTDD